MAQKTSLKQKKVKVINEVERVHYSNLVEITGTQFGDVRLDFSHEIAGPNTIERRVQTSVYLTMVSAKRLIPALIGVVEGYEEAFGTIPVEPKTVKPKKKK